MFTAAGTCVLAINANIRESNFKDLETLDLMPIFRKYQKLTQEYKGSKHKGIDLRSVNFISWMKQSVITTEDMQIKRFGTDRLGNGFIVFTPLVNNDFYEIKYIHVKLKSKINNTELFKGLIIPKHTKIGFTEIAGNSKSHHLHFEVWTDKNNHINPVPYLLANGFIFK